MDIKHYYIEAGEGKPIILLHGNGESHEYFTNQIKYFSKRRRVIALDTRGHGNTPRGTQPFTISRFADDLAEFIDEIGIDRCDILGFSDGANIAMCFAIAYPDRVDRLILNGGNLFFGGLKLKVRCEILRSYRSALKRNDVKNAELAALMINDPALLPSQLNKITSKTLVIAGTRDMVKTNHTRLIARSIRDSKLVFIKGDHFIANNCPDEFNQVIDAFLS